MKVNAKNRKENNQSKTPFYRLLHITALPLFGLSSPTTDNRMDILVLSASPSYMSLYDW